MRLVPATIDGFRRYFDFRTRSSRSDFWWFSLVVVVVNFVVDLIGNFFALPSVLPAALSGQPATFDLLDLLYFLATAVPSTAVTCRRLHDIDRSGWWQLILLVPLLGAIWLLVWLVRRGDVGTNRFGDDPLAEWREASQP